MSSEILINVTPSGIRAVEIGLARVVFYMHPIVQFHKGKVVTYMKQQCHRPRHQYNREQCNVVLM